jgi:alpha-glucuronidase
MGTAQFNAHHPSSCHAQGCTSATKCAPSPCRSAEDGSCPKRWHNYLKLHGNHYWMDPCSNWGYSNYTHLSIGCDRTSLGSGYAAQYPSVLTQLYDDVATCPEELLLFYHHLPWTHKLKSGLTIAQHIVASHAAGLASAARLQALWKSLGGINAKMQAAVGDRFDLQIADARFFAQVLLKYYGAVQGPQPPLV